MNYRMIKNVIGWILLFEAAFMLLPATAALIFKEDAIYPILLSMLVCAAVGALLMLGKPKTKTLYSKEGFVIVSLSWIVLSIFGALPFYFSGVVPADRYLDALFETVSGFTTTGATIFTNVEALPKSILLWRSFTNWIGGMGVLVFIMAFIPLSGGTNMHIMKAESPGPSVSKLVPRVKTTALILYSIYFLLTFLQFILLLFGGMSVFEAICAAFSTAGTGGFGVKNDSFNSYSSYIQIVVTIFMFLFSLNFASYYLAIKGKIKEAFNSEIRYFFIIVIVAIALITFNIAPYFDNIAETIKHSAFTAVSLISTTGFATVDFAMWPLFSRGILLLIMAIGACAGSTGGGIKVSRIIILFKTISGELKYMLHPKQVKKINIDNKPIEKSVARAVASFIICYTIITVISYLLLSFDPHLSNDMETSFSAVVACLNNIGPGLAHAGPYSNYSFFSDPSKFVLIFNMLAGRLELFPMLLLFTPATWKKN